MRLRFKLTSTKISLIIGFFAFCIFSSASVYAVSGSDFRAGRIMDDAVFFNPTSMSAQDIQNFLNAKVPVCDTSGTQPYAGTTRANYGTSRGYPPPYTCLKDYTQAIPNKAADTYCGAIASGTKTSAQIIYEVSQACNVSPKVMIVLLQKEQSLVTDDWPWSIQYRSATGYGCPDTAPCDAEYYGFFNQVYMAARQFQRYAKQPQLYNYRGGQTGFIQYNPNAGCGGTNVFLENQTTAGLYNYTPYQPNAAALSNLYGTGDSCSAYGNRNFWRMYIDWFGSPHSNTQWAWAYEGQWAYSDASRTSAFTSTPTVTPGGKVYVRVKARNMGTQTWENSFTRIGSSRPIDTPSALADATWLSNTRAANLTESTLSPGQIGTFDFVLQAPNEPGTYTQYFNVLAEGRAWMNDPGLFFTVHVANTASQTNNIDVGLNSGESMLVNKHLLSPDSQSALALHSNGNLVLYSNFAQIWQTGVSNRQAKSLIMQPDGNLVVYDTNNVPLWNSETYGNPGARLVLQTDGNMVVYSTSNVALWASYTTHNPDHLLQVNNDIRKGRLYPGQRLETANRQYKLIFQRDGNVVLYSPTKALWATGTDGKSVAFLAMQPDGNLVLYANSGPPLWHSGTNWGGSSRLLIQPDGNLVIYGALGPPTWHTGTQGN